MKRTAPCGKSLVVGELIALRYGVRAVGSDGRQVPLARGIHSAEAYEEGLRVLVRSDCDRQTHPTGGSCPSPLTIAAYWD